MSFGATLRLLRTDAGFTLRELAERLGVSSAYLSRVENGHDAPPTPERLVTLARLLGLVPATLIELADRVTPFAGAWVEENPEARELMIEIMRRNPSSLALARIRAFVERELPLAEEAESARSELRQLFSAERVVVGLGCQTLEDALDVAATRFSPERLPELGRAMREREASCPSVLGGGLAVPHLIVEGARPSAVIVTLRRPVPCDTPDAEPVRLLVAHVHPGGRAHTRLIARLARLARTDVTRTLASERDGRRLVRELLARVG